MACEEVTVDIDRIDTESSYGFLNNIRLVEAIQYHDRKFMVRGKGKFKNE